MAETILLVDDEASLLSYLTSELQFEGYTVMTATDGQAAWQTYQAHANDLSLVLLDWMLPKLDGLEVMRRIRKQSQVPIVMMTARDYVGDKVAGLDNGADDYITKPFEIEELLARLRVILRHAKQRQPESFQVGDLTVDPKARQVRRGAVQAQLTPREYDLLLALMQRPGTAMTRDELLNTVWGSDFAGQVNIVDVYVRYLRHKLDLPGLAPLIHTVRGVGYMIGASA